VSVEASQLLPHFGNVAFSEQVHENPVCGVIRIFQVRQTGGDLAHRSLERLSVLFRRLLKAPVRFLKAFP